MELSKFAAVVPRTSGPPNTFLRIGLILVLTGVGFKLAVVPFHLWTPDVYEGAPLPVTSFIATVSKGGMFALLLRWFHVHYVGLAGAPGLVPSILSLPFLLPPSLLALP